MEFPFLKPNIGKPADAAAETDLFDCAEPLFVEQIRNLRARFEYRADVLNCKVVAVTSAVAGEGKTVAAANLARNIAAAGRKKVLLIDVDLRKCDLAKGMRITPVPGLSEYLAGSAGLKDVLQNSLAPGFHVIPGGMRISSPGDLIAGGRFRGLLKDVRNHVDVIILDTPPIIPVSDTLTLRDVVEGFVLVYRMGATPHLMFRQAMEEIGEKKLVGVVLNGVEPQTEKYYQRYYGKYYQHQKGE